MHDESFEGGCACGQIRYKMKSKPMIVHGCHCRLCQKQSGAAFAINALIEANQVAVTKGEVVEITVPSPSGKGQKIARCPKCQIAVWSNYLIVGDGIAEQIRFIRVGTLDNPDTFTPDVHIYTSTKQPWVILPPDDYAVEEGYVAKETWTPESYKRLTTLKNAAKEAASEQ